MVKLPVTTFKAIAYAIQTLMVIIGIALTSLTYADYRAGWVADAMGICLMLGGAIWFWITFKI